MALGSARCRLGARLGGTRQCPEPSRGLGGESRASSKEAEGIRKRSVEGSGDGSGVYAGVWKLTLHLPKQLLTGFS